jgi:hypothetical protein
MQMTKDDFMEKETRRLWRSGRRWTPLAQSILSSSKVGVLTSSCSGLRRLKDDGGKLMGARRRLQAVDLKT